MKLSLDDEGQFSGGKELGRRIKLNLERVGLGKWQKE